MDKPFKTIDEQIEILKSRGMDVNYDFAYRQLLNKGYYNIINGYKDFFLLPNTDNFKDGTTFNDIDLLFEVDNQLSQLLLSICLDVERRFKTALAYYISQKYGVIEEQYLCRKNYSTGNHIKNNIWQVDETLKIFWNLTKDQSQPIKHYRENHANIPPWILFLKATFGNIYYLFKLCPSSIKTNVISTMLGMSKSLIDDTTRMMFSDTLFLILHFRNRSAHASRIYNFTINAANSFMPYYEKIHCKFGINEAESKSGIGKYDVYAFIIGIYFIDKKLYSHFMEQLKLLLNLYNLRQPNNFKQFLETIGIPHKLLDTDIEHIFPLAI